MQTVHRAMRVFRQEGLRGVLRRTMVLAGGSVAAPVYGGSVSYGDLPSSTPEFLPLVSVIVPNYNHAPYLTQRLDSIYGQSYPHIEVILLDDASQDDSRAILESYAARYPDRTRCCFNDENSGGVFHQWKKGLDLARGELVWIAESDDYCDNGFLAELVRCFQNDGVKLAFGQTAFVEGSPPHVAWTQAQYLHELGGQVWERPFICSAHSLVRRAWGVKNVIPNVSAAVFRHPGKISLFEDPRWLGLRLCGDWVFYLVLARAGLVAYNPAAHNQYRQHAANTSVEAQKEAIYYKEHEVVARWLVTLYGLQESDLMPQEQALYAHWRVRHGEDRRDAFQALYDPRRALATAEPGKPNILMVLYAFVAGGGETFPIMLANELAQHGWGVAVLNCRQQATEPGVRAMVSSQVAVIELETFEHLPHICADMGISVVHSHHAWCDFMCATALAGSSDVKHVVTMHGMYEAMPQQQSKLLVRMLAQHSAAIVYTAKKNLAVVPEAVRSSTTVQRIDNALPVFSLDPPSRESLGIAPDDFVLCLVSRAIPEKGWAEAIEAVEIANAGGDRRIVLLLIGEGPEYKRLRQSPPDAAIRVLGFKPDVRNYFAMSDMGLLPTRFPGESAPLVLIDCLLAGKPMLATDVGEITYMLDTPLGTAGKVLPLSEWQIDVDALATSIREVADSDKRYRELLDRVPLAAARFQMTVMVRKYERLFRDL